MHSSPISMHDVQLPTSISVNEECIFKCKKKVVKYEFVSSTIDQQQVEGHAVLWKWSQFHGPKKRRQKTN